MDAKLAQQLMKINVIKEYVAYVRKEAQELNTIADIESKDPKWIAIEVQARKLAYIKLGEILRPLLESGNEVGKFNNKEYIT